MHNTVETGCKVIAKWSEREKIEKDEEARRIQTLGLSAAETK